MYMEKKIANDDEDYFSRPNNPRELLLGDHLEPFLMLYLKEMKNECIEVLLHPEAAQFLKDKDVPNDEISLLTEEDAVTFKDLFVKKKVSLAHKGCTKQMDTIYEYLIDILTKRVPVDAPNVKLDQIVSKIALIDIPEGVYTEDYTETVKQPPAEEGGEEIEEQVQRTKNTDEKAVIVMKVPQVEEEEEINLEVTDGDGNAKTEIIKRMVDEDQKEQAIVIQGRDVSGIRQVDAR